MVVVADKDTVSGEIRQWSVTGEILVYAQCPSCPLPFRPSEMPFPHNDLPFNALHQSALSAEILRRIGRRDKKSTRRSTEWCGAVHI